MPRSLLRIVGLILVFGLLADPATASAFAHSGTSSTVPPTPTLMGCEALSPLSAMNPSALARRPTKDVAQTTAHQAQKEFDDAILNIINLHDRFNRAATFTRNLGIFDGTVDPESLPDLPYPRRRATLTNKNAYLSVNIKLPRKISEVIRRDRQTFIQKLHPRLRPFIKEQPQRYEHVSLSWTLMDRDIISEYARSVVIFMSGRMMTVPPFEYGVGADSLLLSEAAFFLLTTDLFAPTPMSLEKMYYLKDSAAEILKADDTPTQYFQGDIVHGTGAKVIRPERDPEIMAIRDGLFEHHERTLKRELSIMVREIRVEIFDGRRYIKRPQTIPLMGPVFKKSGTMADFGLAPSAERGRRKNLNPDPVFDEKGKLREGYVGPAEVLGTEVLTYDPVVVDEIYRRLTKKGIYRGLTFKQLDELDRALWRQYRRPIEIHWPENPLPQHRYVVRKNLKTKKLVAYAEREDPEFRFVVLKPGWGKRQTGEWIPQPGGSLDSRRTRQVTDLLNKGIRRHIYSALLPPVDRWEEMLRVYTTITIEQRRNEFTEQTEIEVHPDGTRSATIYLVPMDFDEGEEVHLSGDLSEAAGWLVHGPQMSQRELTARNWKILWRQFSAEPFLYAYGHLAVGSLQEVLDTSFLGMLLTLQLEDWPSEDAALTVRDVFQMMADVALTPLHIEQILAHHVYHTRGLTDIFEDIVALVLKQIDKRFPGSRYYSDGSEKLLMPDTGRGDFPVASHGTHEGPKFPSLPPRWIPYAVVPVIGLALLKFFTIRLGGAGIPWIVTLLPVDPQRSTFLETLLPGIAIAWIFSFATGLWARAKNIGSDRTGDNFARLLFLKGGVAAILILCNEHLYLTSGLTDLGVFALSLWLGGVLSNLHEVKRFRGVRDYLRGPRKNYEYSLGDHFQLLGGAIYLALNLTFSIQMLRWAPRVTLATLMFPILNLGLISLGWVYRAALRRRSSEGWNGNADIEGRIPELGRAKKWRPLKQSA